MAIIFKEDKIYHFGILIDKFDPASGSEPKWQSNGTHKPIALPGTRLLDNQIETFEQFIGSQFCPYPSNKTVSVYQENYDKNGNYTGKSYLGSLNPMPRAKSEGLADGMTMPSPFTVQMSQQGTMSKETKEIYSMMNKQFDNISKQLQTVNDEYSKFRDGSIARENELRKRIAELEVENQKLEITNKTLEGMAEKFGEKPSALADGLSNALMNPALIQVGATIVDKLLSRFFPDEQAPAIPQQPQQTAQQAQPQAQPINGGLNDWGVN